MYVLARFYCKFMLILHVCTFTDIGTRFKSEFKTFYKVLLQNIFCPNVYFKLFRVRGIKW